MKAGIPHEPALQGKHLFIEHLAQQLEAMEQGRAPVKAVAYRLFSRRLRQAMAGYPETRLAASLAGPHPAVAEGLAVRFFDTHGRLPGPGGRAAQEIAAELLARLRQPAP
ncbi:hypothetical protein [Caldimonas tepidiphila]|uniref:hypothetical protein n=1 Tax=Caldimonas tepidiphila TaxID=2315841 RepID=UPI000E5B7E5F|nr:hypothetical protein [Caldimonas tepidiphila]